MSLYDAARDAYRAEEGGRSDEARAALAGVLDPHDVAALTVAHYEPGMFVFTDGDVHLAVRDRDGWQVTLVTDDQGWTAQGEVDSLAELGRLLPPRSADGEVYPAWVEPTDKASSYQIGDRVSHVGRNWESTVKDNSSEPGVSGWTEIT